MRTFRRFVAVLAVALTASAMKNYVRADVLIDIGWEADAVDTKLNAIPGWMTIPGSDNVPAIAVDSAEPNNQFLTTGAENNQATRDAFIFTNPGFNSNTTLTFTADIWDPLLNEATTNVTPVHTFQRVVIGIFEQGGAATMPSFFGIEHINGDPTVTEWSVAEENFANRQLGPTDGILQDTWYTMRSVWDLGANTKTLEAKLRDSADPFTTIFASAPIGFVDPNQDLSALNAFAMRMQRGTRIDNILVDVVGAVALSDADFNSDGSVDEMDLGLWEAGFGLNGSAGRTDGDANMDGIVDGTDFLIWQQENGTGVVSAASASTVPEPATWGMFLLGLMSFVRIRQFGFSG